MVQQLNLQEWFAVNVTLVSQKLMRANEARIGGMMQLSNDSIQHLQALAKDFEDISHTCLLILHLEVSCFYT